MLSRRHEIPFARRDPIDSQQNVEEFERILADLAAVRRRTATCRRPRSVQGWFSGGSERSLNRARLTTT